MMDGYLGGLSKLIKNTPGLNEKKGDKPDIAIQIGRGKGIALRIDGDIYDDARKIFNLPIKKRKKVVRELITEAEGDKIKRGKYEGHKISDLSDDEFLEYLKEERKKTDSRATVFTVLAGAYDDDLREKTIDSALSQIGSLSKFFVSTVSTDLSEDGGHTVTIAGTETIDLGTMISMLDNMLSRLIAERVEVDNMVDLHQAVYNIAILVAVAHAKLAARIHLKDVDTAGLLENDGVNQLFNDGSLCKALEGTPLQETELGTNPKSEELRKLIKIEKRRSREMFEEEED